MGMSNYPQNLTGMGAGTLVPTLPDTLIIYIYLDWGKAQNQGIGPNSLKAQQDSP
jgi:hypothetical protein